MPSLLSLPREIRDSILELVLFAVRPAPDVSLAEKTRAPFTTTSTPWGSVPGFKSWSYGPENVHMEQTSYTSNSAPLLRVNHQLAAETAAALARLSPLPCELDVLFFKEAQLWPTWLRVPVLAKQLDQVNATFRIMGNDVRLDSNGEEMRYRSAWRGGDGGPPQILWAFYYLLEHVLRRGPVARTATAVDQEISIKVLDINFVGDNSHPQIDGDASSVGDDCAISCTHGKQVKYTCHQPVRERMLRSAYLCRQMASHFLGLCSMGYHTSEYGGFLHARIGAVRFRVNGILWSQKHLGDYLRELERDSDRDTFGHLSAEKRVAAFQQWKKATLEKREKRGLEVDIPKEE